MSGASAHMVWASAPELRARVADVPRPWLAAWAARHPADVRKFSASRNGSMLYRVSAVLAAIECGEGMDNGGAPCGGYPPTRKRKDEREVA